VIARCDVSTIGLQCSRVLMLSRSAFLWFIQVTEGGALDLWRVADLYQIDTLKRAVVL